MDNVEHLARSTDRDVADWRTTLNNHTETLNGMGKKIDLFQERVDERFGKVDEELADVRSEMRKGFGKLAKGQELITDLLTRHLGKPGEAVRVDDTNE
jgi:hypothetical protein